MASLHRPVAALDLSLVEGTWKESLLSFIYWVDGSVGSDEWTTRQVAFFSVLVLGLVKLVTGEKLNVRWYSLLHASVTGYFSLVCVLLNVFAAEQLTGTTEPLRSTLCRGPLTSFHRIVPAITMGFGCFDIIEGLSHGFDFVMHGVATLTIMAYFTEYDLGEIIVPMLLMEISTPFLTLTRFELFNDKAQMVNIAFFVLSFFIFRVLIVPYLMVEIWWTTVVEKNNLEAACMPWHFSHVIFIFGCFFNCLNAYWFYKIILKVKRKINGEEKVTESNNLGDHQKQKRK